MRVTGETDSADDAADVGAGGYSIAGFEYQIDVSVWIALDVVVASKLARELILEPASQEDLEVELKDAEPGRLTSKTDLDGYTLVVQAKRRTGDAWTVAGIKSLLKHGSENRPSAATRLKNPSIRYLLVTSAGLNGGAQGLKVRRAGVWPKAEGMASSIASSLPCKAAGRVAVVANQDEERLETDIRRLLTESFGVPAAAWKDCHGDLREQARARIGGAAGGKWYRSDLEAVIRQRGGYLASSPELDRYVFPTNWQDLREAMRAKNAAMIIGQSGTGKTLATRKLYEELRQEIPGLSHVPIRLGPHQLRDDRTEPPVLYDIEDPWGRFDFDPARRPWNDQLADFFAHASHDRMIIATSRLDVAQASGALGGVGPWLVPLEAEHYRRRERQELYASRVDSLPRDLQTVALGARNTVLKELATPLEIQKFFDALRAIDRSELKYPGAFVGEAVRRAHANSIEQTVIEQIEEREDVKAASVIWVLLKAADKLSTRTLRVLQDELADRDHDMERGVTPLIEFFVAARNLRQAEEVITYYHPRVEAGIQTVLKRHPGSVRKTIANLIAAILSFDDSDTEWSAALAARVLAAANRFLGLHPKLQDQTRDTIDEWLANRLAEPGKEFADDLSLAADAGSVGSNIAETARYLLHRPDTRFEGLMLWGAPSKPDAWYERLRADPAVKRLVETFIREVLPTSRDDYGDAFLNDVERLAPELTPAFLDAAETAVHYGVIYNDDLIAAGAMRDLDGFERVVEIAIAVRTPSREELADAAELRLALINGEYSADYAEHLADDDSGHTAGEFLEAYVERVRRDKGWSYLLQHPHSGALLSYWVRELTRCSAKGTIDPREVAAAFAAGYGTSEEDSLWFIIARNWDENFRAGLIKRLFDGHSDSSVRRAALSCLLEHVLSEFAPLVARLEATRSRQRLVELALDISEIRQGKEFADGEDRPLLSAIASMPAPFAEISAADYMIATNETRVQLSLVAIKILTAIGETTEEVRSFRIRVDNIVSLPIEDDIRWIVSNSDDPDTVYEAVAAAARRGMRSVLALALDHRFATVSAYALKTIGEAQPAPLPTDLLEKVHVRGNPVRRALVALLREKSHPDHIPTLLLLAHDKWSKSSRYHGERDHFPIARTAVEALGNAVVLNPKSLENLYSLALDTSDAILMGMILRLLVSHGGEAYQIRLLELAAAPGRVALRTGAAHAMQEEANDLSPTVIRRIDFEHLSSLPAAVAIRLAYVLGLRASSDWIHRVGSELAASLKRRVLLLVLIRMRSRGPERSIALSLVGQLPQDHPATSWALGEDLSAVDGDVLADLGDPLICAEVERWMKAQPKRVELYEKEAVRPPSIDR
ncbi:hypothetical protein ASG42_23310 [Rhizobium sp. Leaf391]|nr:hypothetical protein ASG42_23310 [Rhizobium sp. Leaf391]